MEKSGIRYGDVTSFSCEMTGALTAGKYGNYLVELPEKFSWLGSRLEHPRDGISVLMTDVTPDEDVVCRYEIGTGAVCMHTVLSANAFDYGCSGDGEASIAVSSPCDMVTLYDDCEGRFAARRGVRARYVGVYIDRAFVHDLLEGEDRYSPVNDMVNKRRGGYLLGRFEASPQTQLIATQMLECDYEGPCRKLFMESKSLELIAASLHRMVDGGRKTAISLTRDDVDRIHEARRLLLRDMEAPPGIKELSVMTGLNEFKLKRGFREVFDCTVYQALRAHRMESARAMLLDTDVTVGTVAATVGYTNMSHFIAAFKGRFGVTPGALLSHSRRRCLT